jgi:hypothetical protein
MKDTLCAVCRGPVGAVASFMPEQLWFTEILNRLFAGPVTALLRALHIEPKHPQASIPNTLAMELLVFLISCGAFPPGPFTSFRRPSLRIATHVRGR